MKAVALAFLISVLPGVAHADDEPTEAPPPTPIQPAPINPAPEVPAEDPPQHSEKPVVHNSFRPREIVIDVPGLRTTNQKVVVASLFGAGAIGGAIGLFFNLQSRSDANKVNAQLFTGKAWTSDREQAYDDTKIARNRAAVGYSIGGAFVIAAIAVYIATEPRSERTVIRPHAAVTPTVDPAGSITGAMAGVGGSF